MKLVRKLQRHFIRADKPLGVVVEVAGLTDALAYCDRHGLPVIDCQLYTEAEFEARCRIKTARVHIKPAEWPFMEYVAMADRDDVLDCEPIARKGTYWEKGMKVYA